MNFGLLGLPGVLKACGAWTVMVGALTITEWNTLGIVVVAIVVALFSLRYAERSVYKQNYEAQKARAEEAEREIKVQDETRHDLKNRLTATQLQLDVEKQRPDLAAVLERIAEVLSRDDDLILTLTRMEERLLAAYSEQSRLLGEIAGTLSGQSVESTTTTLTRQHKPGKTP